MSAFFTSLKKNPFAILLVFLLIACAVAAWPLLRPPVFQAGARINIPETKSSPAPQGVSLQTAVEILQGNVLAEQVMTAIGITKLFPDLEKSTQGEKDLTSQAVANFQQQLSISPIKETRIIHINFQHQEADLSAQVVETLIRLFQKEYRIFQAPEESRENEQLLLALREMHQATQSLSMFQQQNKLLLVGDASDKLKEQYDTMKTLLSNEQESLQKQKSQLQKLEEQFTQTLRPVALEIQQEESTEFRQVQNDLIRLKIYEQELRERYGEGGSGERLITNVGLQVNSLEKLLYDKAAVSEGEQKKLDETVEQIVAARTSYHNHQQKTELLQRQLRQVENKLQQVTEQDDLLGQFQQQAENAQRRYADLVQQFETEWKRKERTEQVRIIEKPVIPTRPIKPQQKTAVVLALLSGLIGSVVYGVIRAIREGASTN